MELKGFQLSAAQLPSFDHLLSGFGRYCVDA
jgi:hypothetical protein